MFRRILTIACLLSLSPKMSAAQAEYQFANFATTSNGFTATLLFRNIGTYASSNIVELRSFRIVASSRIKTVCSAPTIDCVLNSATLGTHPVGNIQQTDFVASGATWLGGNDFVEDSCAGFCDRLYYLFGGFGVMPCQVPLFAPVIVGEYVARTCSTDGFDGWLAQDVSFHTNSASAAQFDVTDLSATFGTIVRDGPSALTIPEPSTWVLTASGLLTLGIMARRRERRA